MSDRRSNEQLRRLYRETGWTLRQFAQAVNKVATERGRPTRYQDPSVHQWLSGHLPREDVRPLVLEALSRQLHRPVTALQAGFPSTPAQDVSNPGTVDGLVDLGASDMDPARRSVVGASLFSVALAVPGWQDVVGRMEAAQTGQVRRIGMPEVDMVVAMTEQISGLDDQFGGRHARPMAAAFLVNTVAPTCGPTHRNPSGRR